MNFKLTKKDGINYANLSGDYNKIHLDTLEGHNSNFGKNICHGTLVINKFLKKININKIIKNKNKFSLSFKFQNFFEYDKTIYISKNFKKIFQKKSGTLHFDLSFKNILSDFNINKIKEKNFKIKMEESSSHFENIEKLLNHLSRYVGMIFPGKYSIINSININYNINNKFKKNYISFYSKKNSNLPIIENKIIYDEYIIDFISLKRPIFEIKKNKVNRSLIKKIQTITDPVLIIGSSSGIGLEILRIFENNSKIKIFSTFYKNKVKPIKKNVHLIKLDINKNLSIIKKIIMSNENIRIFYMPTPKINIDENDKKQYKIYKKFYLDNVLKILSFCAKSNVKFFYPSTAFIDNFKSDYTKIKLLSENKLKNLRKNNIKINILRISEVNTKQNLSILKDNLPTFTYLFNKNKEYQKKILFL